MNFLFAKLFDEYQRKGDSPIFSITMYISTIYFFVLFCIYLSVSEVLNKIYFANSINYNKIAMSVTVILVMVSITAAVYAIYIKNRLIFRLSEKYKTKILNKIILYGFVIFLPILLLFVATTSTVLLKGGIMFGLNIKGVF